MAKTYYFKDENEEKKYFENQKKMEENSQKWHETDDADEKARLHFQNQVMSGENDLIDGGNRTFDENSGVWSVDYGSKAQSSVPWKNEQENKYVSPYNDEINALYDEIVNQGSFSYNPENDASYKAYENMYRREGDRASKSTLADVAAAQGGVSSYAASAAQQASNAYAQALTDKIPELEALAYQKYSADRNDKYNQLNSLMALDNTAYGRYSDDWNRGMTEKQFNEDIRRYDQEFNYMADIDKRDFDYKVDTENKNFNYMVEQNEIANEWNQIDFGQEEYQIHYTNGVNALTSGLMPNETQLYAMEMTADEAMDYLRRHFPKQYGYSLNSSNGNSGGKGGNGNDTVKKPGEETMHIIRDYPLTYEDYQIEQIDKYIDEVYKLNQEGHLSDSEAKMRIARIQQWGLNR